MDIPMDCIKGTKLAVPLASNCVARWFAPDRRSKSSGDA